MWSLARLSCPILLASFSFHFGIHLYWVLVANLATYALAGLILEGVRKSRQFNSHHRIV